MRKSRWKGKKTTSADSDPKQKCHSLVDIISLCNLIRSCAKYIRNYSFTYSRLSIFIPFSAEFRKLGKYMFGLTLRVRVRVHCTMYIHIYTATSLTVPWTETIWTISYHMVMCSTRLCTVQLELLFVRHVRYLVYLFEMKNTSFNNFGCFVWMIWYIFFFSVRYSLFNLWIYLI